MAASPARIRSLYRQLLQHAARFPSIKQKAIIRDIRIEFREGATLTDPAKIKHSLEVAMRGLETLQKYTLLDKASPSWTVTLEQDPLGEGAAQQRRAEDIYAQRKAAAQRDARAAPVSR